MTQTNKNEKDLAYYMGLKYPIEIVEDDGQFVASVPELPGCVSFGDTLDDAVNNLQATKELWIKGCIESNQPVPEPVCVEEYSGKFVLRIPRSLHCSLIREAKKQGISLNQHVSHVLSERHQMVDLEKSVERAVKAAMCADAYGRSVQPVSLWAHDPMEPLSIEIHSHASGVSSASCSGMFAYWGGTLMGFDDIGAGGAADLSLLLNNAPKPPKTFNKVLKKAQWEDIYQKV